MRRLILAFASVALLAACGGGDGTTNPPAGTPGITLTASSTSGTVARGASTTTTLTLGRVDGFAGAVALTAEGAPTGVTVAFSPQSLTGTTLSSTATITVANTATAGASTITLRAAGSGVTDKTVQFALTIPTPAITVSAGTGAVTAVQGTSVTVPITITRINGATGNINLTAEGLPANVTAAFVPAAIADGATTSTLTLTVGANATAAVSNVTVRAAATGTTDQTATIALTITSAAVPAFTLTAAPAALSVVAGQSGNSVLTITKTGGFAANVALTLEGAPAGVTGTFAPNPATGTTSTLTLNSTLATVPGTYNLTVRGASAGLTDRTTVIAFTVTAVPGVTLAIAPAALTIAQGATGQSVITLTRLGGLAGDVQLTATSSAGITTAFAPAAVAGTSSTLTVTVGGAAAVGTSNVVITATGAGGVTANITLPVTVTVAAGFTLTATNASVVQSATGTSTITITRTGGFAANVDLTATGLPANVSASFAPASAPAGTSTLTFAATAGATPGTYTVTVNGTGTGAANQSTTLTLTVTASGGGGGNVSWRFCDATRTPLWFAYRNGSAGAWTRVTPTGDSFNFTLTGGTGAVAYVLTNGVNGTAGTVFMNTTAELTATAASECVSAPTTKTVNGSFSGLAFSMSSIQMGTAYMGFGSGTATAPTLTFAFNGVQDRLTDILAIRSTTTIMPLATTPDRGVLRRNVNYGAGSTAPVLDFAGAESFALATGLITVGNLNGDNATALVSFQTTNGAVGTIPPTSATTTSPVTVYGVPSSRTQAGDFHSLIVAGTNAGLTTFRTVFQYNRELTDRTVTLGANLTAPTITSVAGAPYGRLRVQGTWQNEYNDGVGTTMSQQTSPSRSWTVSASHNYFGTGVTTFDLELPDFSAVTGFNNVWGLVTGAPASVNTTVNGTFSGTPNVITENYSFKAASRTQTATP